MSDRSEIEMAHAAALKAEADWRAMRDQCARHARRIEELERTLEEIARLDYRGYPHESARIARKALSHD